MGLTITAFSATDAADHEAQLFADGVASGTRIAATTGPVDSYSYTFTVPSGTAVGSYAYALYETINGRLRSQGAFYWDGTDVFDAEPVATSEGISRTEVRAEVDAALTAYDSATGAEVDAVSSAISSLINSLNNLSVAQVQGIVDGIPAAPTVTEIEAALLDDGDGAALVAAIAAAVENSLLDETDSRAFFAAVQGATGAALLDYDGPTKAELDGALAALPAGITTGQVRFEADAALVAYNGATEADVLALNDVAMSEVQSAIDTLRVEVGGDIDDSELRIVSSVDALEDLSEQTLQSLLDDQSVDMTAEIAQAVSDILDQAGLTVEQGDILTFIRDVAEADELYDSTIGKAQKYLKGTDTLLVDKDVVSTTSANVRTTITEVVLP